MLMNKWKFFLIKSHKFKGQIKQCEKQVFDYLIE